MFSIFKKIKSLLLLLCFMLSSLAWGQIVEINQASEADLDALKGLGPSTTRRILEARSQAPFANWQDLRERIKGIGVKRASRLSENGLRVNGQIYPNTNTNTNTNTNNLP